MFVHTCSSCHRRQLMSSGQITALVNTDHGIVVSFTCWCGAEQTMVTGSRAAEAPAPVRVVETPVAAPVRAA